MSEPLNLRPAGKPLGENHFDIPAELKKLPKQPGVYIMRDASDQILYVGKAVNLHNRVRSYFRKIVGDDWVPGKNTPFDPVASKKAASLGMQVVCSKGTQIQNTMAILRGQPFVGTTIG